MRSGSATICERNLPYGEQVVGTITAVDTFLGVILGISTSQYNKATDKEK